MVVNNKLFLHLNQSPHGKRLLMIFAATYLQERMGTDKNALLQYHNPQLHNRLAYFQVDQKSIQFEGEGFFIWDRRQIKQRNTILDQQVDLRVKQEKK